MSTHNICFSEEIRKISFFFYEKQSALAKAMKKSLIVTTMVCQ